MAPFLGVFLCFLLVTLWAKAYTGITGFVFVGWL